MSKIFGPLSGLVRQFEGVPQSAFGTALQFVAYGPMVRANEILRPFSRRINQHHRSLKIVEQNLVRLVGQFAEQPLKQPLGLVGVTARLQENEGLSQFDVLRAVHVKLAEHHQTAKDQQHQKKQKKLILAEEPHRHCLCPSRVGGSNVNRNQKRDGSVCRKRIEL